MSIKLNRLRGGEVASRGNYVSKYSSVEAASRRWVAMESRNMLSLSQEIQSTEDYSKGINMVSEKKIGRCKIDPGVPLCGCIIRILKAII